MLISTSVFGQSNGQTACTSSQFHFNVNGSCNYANLFEKFEDYFDNDPIVSADCGHNAEAELDILLGASNNPASRNEKVQAICRDAFESYDELPFTKIANKGGNFEQVFYNGGTDWNEEVQTDYPKDENDNPTNVLRSGNGIVGDAERVKSVYDGEAQYGMIEWPDHLTNFEPDKCKHNAAMCCWPKDRQAQDNNGNCNTPYDKNCVDKDVSDNTNLCYVDLNRGTESTGFSSTSGYELFPFDDDNGNTDDGEGPIHCHGLAWADDETHESAVYKGNNLFYISMYDHMHQRGYVKNVPGAPMCGCVEQMPVVSRADCTQIDVEQKFMFTFDETFSANVEQIYIDFNACQGIDRIGNNDNNDLWAYMNRLVLDGRVSREKIGYLSENLVGDSPDRCNDATEKFMATKNQENAHVIGYKAAETMWDQVAGKGGMLSSPYAKGASNVLLDKSPNDILRRICADCYVTHQDIYVRRTTPYQDLDFLEFLKSDYSSTNKTGYTWDTDFKLYSTYDDAVYDNNAWDCAAQGGYTYRGFPGSCGPISKRDNQWARFEPNMDGRYHAAWYIEKDINRNADYLFKDEIGTNINMQTSYPDRMIYQENAGTTRSITNSENSTDLYISSAGGDIYHNKDSFHFHSEEANGNVEMIVNVKTFHYLQAWSKAGLMIRDTLDPDSQHYSIFLTGTQGISTMYRSITGDRTHHYREQNTDATWLKLTKQENVFSSYYSVDGEDWVRLNTNHLEFDKAAGGNENIGLAVAANYNTGQIAEVIFEDYEVVKSTCTVARRNLGSTRRL